MRLNVLSAAALAAAPAVEAKAKNFVYVVPDGFGTASQVMARDFQNIVNGEGTVERPNAAIIGADSMLMGSVRTYSSDNLVTDSAASGTAFACGIKTYNGAIGVDDDGKPVGSVLEAAHLSGLKTGLVVTSRITHATPASYSAHVLDRDSENEIASHQIGHTHPFGPYVDILLGGGRQHYLPASEGGSREDGVNLVDFALENGYTYASDAAGIEDVLVDGGKKLPLPFLGLLADSHLDYEMDRDPEEQFSLLKMVELALASLESSSGSPNSTKLRREADEDEDAGFFLMVEASRVDHAGHANDAASHVHEALMFNEVMAHLKTYVTSHPDTQLLSAADHECGGLTLMDGFDPTVLARAQNSGEHLEALFDALDDGEDKAAYLKDTLLPLYGLTEGSFTDDDVAVWLDVYESEGTTAMSTAILHAFAAEAGVNWSTGGHTAADVQLHGFAAGDDAWVAMRRELGTNVNNIELPVYVQKALGLAKTMDDATEALRKDGVDWVQRRDMLEVIKRDNAAARHHAHHS